MPSPIRCGLPVGETTSLHTGKSWHVNAFTESLKDGNLAELPKRTEALHGLLDTHVGLLS